MPNTNPPTTTIKLLEEKMTNIYPNRSFTDYAFFMGVSKDSLDELRKVDEEKIVGVKMFMAGHETTPTTIPDNKTLAQIFEIISQKGLIAAVHAEDQALVNYYNDKYKYQTSAETWSKMRPKEVIVAAVARAIALADVFNIPLYLLHLSTPEEFVLVDDAKKRGSQIFGELVGYQLNFNINDYAEYGNKIKVAPALRTPQDQEEMWNRLRKGGIDVICSEHTPHEWETKNQPDVRKAQAGTPGIQETLPALTSSYIKRFGKETIGEFLQLMSFYTAYNPARIFGFASKGDIAVGKDADFTILDTNSTWNVKKEDLFSKCGWSAYEGQNLVGRPIATFLRGNLVYENGKILGVAKGKLVEKTKSKYNILSINGHKENKINPTRLESNMVESLPLSK